MTHEEKLAYARGYNAGVNGRWPEHRPPIPPNEIMKSLLKSVLKLRDVADNYCATFLPDDPMTIEMSPLIDSVDEAMISISEWLRIREGGVLI